MPDKRPSIKNERQYEALKDKGMSKERAARIANSGGFEPGWQEVRFGRQLQAGGDDRAEDGGRAQGRPGIGSEELVEVVGVVRRARRRPVLIERQA
jgi:hypothetical protein